VYVVYIKWQCTWFIIYSCFFLNSPSELTFWITLVYRILKCIFGFQKVTVRAGKGKAVLLQAQRCPEGSRKLRFPDFVTMAQDGGRLSAVRTGHLYHREILLVLISVRG